MRPSLASHRWFNLVGAIAALTAGIALGWRFTPPPAPPPSVSPASTAPAKPPPPLTAGTANNAPPYDLRPLQNPSSQELAAFEAWLASATCEEVWALVGDKPVDRALPSPVVTALLLQRFRSFPAAERLALLRKHAEPGKKFYDARQQKIWLNLMTDLLPAHPQDAAFVAKHVQDAGGYQTAVALADWARQDFDAALAFATSLGISEARWLPSLIGFLAQADVTAAQRQVTRLPAGTDRDQALAVVGNHLAVQDLATAITWMQENGGGRPSGSNPFESPLTQMLSDVANRDAASVAAVLLDQPGLFEGPGGADRVTHLFQNWARQDSAAAAAWLQANPLPEGVKTLAEAALFRHQLMDLPQEEIVSAWQAQPEAVQQSVARNLALRLAEGDPATVLDRVAAAFPVDQRSQALGWALFRVPATESAQILRWLPDLIPHFKKNSGYDSWLREVPPEQLQQALAQLPEADRHLLQERTAQVLIGEDPERALAALPPVEPNKPDPFLYSHLANELVQSNPEKAAAWVAGFVEGSSKEWAAQNVVAAWGKFDPASAAKWVETLPAGNSRDRATVELAFLHSLTGGHTTALDLAATVQDTGRRLDATGFALHRLWHRDPTAAESALAASRLTADQQRTLMTRLAMGEFAR